MNKNTVIVMSIAAIALSGFAFNKFYQSDQQSAQIAEPTISPAMQAPLKNEQSASEPIAKHLHEQPAPPSSEQLTEKSTHAEVPNKPMANALLAKSSANNKPAPARDHQTKHAVARPHGHEHHGTQHHPATARPPGEPKKPAENQPPVN